MLSLVSLALMLAALRTNMFTGPLPPLRLNRKGKHHVTLFCTYLLRPVPSGRVWPQWPVMAAGEINSGPGHRARSCSSAHAPWRAAPDAATSSLPSCSAPELQSSFRQVLFGLFGTNLSASLGNRQCVNGQKWLGAAALASEGNSRVADLSSGQGKMRDGIWKRF
jgi:hypothetical protein